jgi:hypothetical protein
MDNDIIDEGSEDLHLFKRVKVGRTNVLKVVKRLPFGAYLSPGSSKTIQVQNSFPAG